jgi:cytoplasmic iron level regulating protein YaaA (DUF328/UPF0246 family)
MLAILSPSKTLDFDSPPRVERHSIPAFLDDAEQLVKSLRRYSRPKLTELMGISERLADENHERYQQWRRPFSIDNAKQAVLAFRGDVYDGLDADSMTADDLDYAQDHALILSGLYGVLRPLDLMRPYRLEMGTALATKRGEDLYAFWGDRLTKAINEAMTAAETDVLVNLASNEYVKAIQPKQINGRIITPAFKQRKGDKVRTVALYSKQARGRMANYLITKRVEDLLKLKRFRRDGYRYDAELSSDDAPVFVRDED